MFDETGPERAVLGIFHSEFKTGLFHNPGHSRIIHMANTGKEVVFEMKIQATKEPCPYPTLAVIIKRYLRLMYGPWVLHLGGKSRRVGENQSSPCSGAAGIRRKGVCPS